MKKKQIELKNIVKQEIATAVNASISTPVLPSLFTEAIILSDFNSEIKKTKEMNLILKKFEISNSIIILDKTSKDKVEESMRNIPNVKITDVNHFSAFDLVKFKKVVFTETSVKALEKRYK